MQSALVKLPDDGNFVRWGRWFVGDRNTRAIGPFASVTMTDYIARRVDEPFWSALQTVQGLYKHQILVDEATDFSPIQLACMAALAHPQLRSFFACGDFNQRLTTWGSRSLDEMRWVLPDIEQVK